MIVSRFAQLSVSLTRKASPFQLVAALREEHEAELARMLEAAAQQAAEGAAVEQPAQATPTPAPAAGPFNYTPDDRAGME